MKIYTCLFILSVSYYSISAQIPTIRTDTVKPTSPYAQQKDLTPTYIINPGFEDGLLGWTTTGNAFNQIVGGNMVSSERVRTEMLYQNGGIGGDYWKNMSYSIGSKGQRWMGTYEKGNGNTASGSITSAPFKMNKRYLLFLLGGGHDYSKLYVELQVKGTAVKGYGTTADGYTRVKKITPEINSEELFRYWFEIPEILGQPSASLKTKPPIVRIVIADNSNTDPWGHINADDFQMSDCLDDFLVIRREGKTLYADKDRPVWGFADTHSHPMGHVAFGGRAMTGDPDGPMEAALANSKCTDNGHQGNLLLLLAPIRPGIAWLSIQMYDPHGPEGYPTFGDWPKFNVDLHQPMYIDWIKRSYQGGLRVLSVLGVTNMFWATRGLGIAPKPELPIDDESVALLAIAGFKEIVRKNSDWMEIALTPGDARRIILENKLAIVLGVEMDNFGNFKDASYPYREPYDKPPSASLVPLALDLNQARIQIRKKLKQYHDLGIRQITALHYISGVFGGTAVFRFQFGMIQGTFTGHPYVLKEGKDLGVTYNLYNDVQGIQVLLGNTTELFSGDIKGYFNCDPSSGKIEDFKSCNNLYSVVNAEGLEERGKILFEEMMNSGFIIDVDHSSTVSANDIFNIAKPRKYPLLSSHTDPMETCLSPSSGLKFMNKDDNPMPDYQNFGTTIIGNLSTEFTPSRSYYENISNSGGVAGLFLFPFRKKQFGTAVANDCDGSSKSWAQNYLYTMSVMKGKGIGVASDKGFTEAVGPRFGPNAAYKLKEEKIPELKYSLRTEQRAVQAQAIKYDIPFKDWNPKRFDAGQVLELEEDIWKALAFWEANPAIRIAKPQDSPLWLLIPASDYVLQGDRIKNLVVGLAMTDLKNLLPTGLFSGTDQPWQQAMMYCFSHNISPSQLPNIYDQNYRATIQKNYDQWHFVYDLWKRMVSGSNEPLRKLVNGNRDWDFNIDGMAHYGMIPDLLQDLKNIGIKADMMIPLFSSAEEYVRMWEKADSASGKKTACTATSSFVNQTGCNSYTSPSGKHTWTVSGIYKDTIQNISCCDSVITINLTIQKVDTAIKVNGTTITANAQQASFMWINCSTNEIMRDVPTLRSFTPTVSGSYAVQVNQSGCIGVSSCYNIVVGSVPVKNEPPKPPPITLPRNASSLKAFIEKNKIVANDRTNNDEFGRSVSISGNYAIVGVPIEREDAKGVNPINGAGAAYIYKLDDGGKWKQLQKIVAGDRGAGDNFGCSVGISGGYIIIGARYDHKNASGIKDNNLTGSAYVFELNQNGTWYQTQKITADPASRGAQEYFGTAVTIEGTTIVVSSPDHAKDVTNSPASNINAAGALYVFDRVGGTWIQTQKLVTNDRDLGSWLGNSVAICGNNIIAGAWGGDHDANRGSRMEAAGTAYIFERNGLTWKQTQKLVASDRSPYDEFGFSVAISGDYAVVGARRVTEKKEDEDNGQYTGNAYIFKRNAGGGWSQQMKINPDDRTKEDYLGTAVGISGDYLIVSAPGQDTDSLGNYMANAGAIYVYYLDKKGNWNLVDKISTFLKHNLDGFGYAAAISDCNIIGTSWIDQTDEEDKNAITNAGSAHIFTAAGCNNDGRCSGRLFPWDKTPIDKTDTPKDISNNADAIIPRPKTDSGKNAKGKYDISKIEMSIDKISNNQLPAREPNPFFKIIPAIKPDGK